MEKKKIISKLEKIRERTILENLSINYINILLAYGYNFDFTSFGINIYIGGWNVTNIGK